MSDTEENKIYDLRKKIQELQSEIKALGEPSNELPELISSANLLRSNEYLSKSDKKKSELLLIYGQYSKYLEDMLSTVFDIQNDLKNILKEQSILLSKTQKSTIKTKPKTKRKTAKK